MIQRPIDSHRSSMLDDWAALMAGERLPHTPAADAKHGLEALVARLVTEEFDRRATKADATTRVQQPTVRHCIELAASEFDVSVAEIKGPRKYKQLALARHTAFWLAQRVTSLSYPEMGVHFHRNHATVWNGVTRVDERRLGDHDFRERTDRLLSLFIGDA